ncbi:hypothetical protein AABB24_021426, partial [Solanum stoloniferum]
LLLFHKISHLLNYKTLIVTNSARHLSTTHFEGNKVDQMSLGEIACTYACLILNDEDIPITSEKISTLVKTANVAVEPYWPLLFAKLAEKKNLGDLIMNVGAGGGGGAAVAVAAPTGGAAAAAAPAAEEKKEKPKEESDDDMGFSLFD